VLSNRIVSWSVADSGRVDILGSFGYYVIVRAVGAGTTTLRAASEGKEGRATLTVQ
jgi:hypothetical protein